MENRNNVVLKFEVPIKTDENGHYPSFRKPGKLEIEEIVWSNWTRTNEPLYRLLIIVPLRLDDDVPDIGRDHKTSYQRALIAHMRRLFRVSDIDIFLKSVKTALWNFSVHAVFDCQAELKENESFKQSRRDKSTSRYYVVVTLKARELPHNQVELPKPLTGNKWKELSVPLKENFGGKREEKMRVTMETIRYCNVWRFKASCFLDAGLAYVEEMLASRFITVPIESLSTNEINKVYLTYFPNGAVEVLKWIRNEVVKNVPFDTGVFWYTEITLKPANCNIFMCLENDDVVPEEEMRNRDMQHKLAENLLCSKSQKIEKQIPQPRVTEHETSFEEGFCVCCKNIQWLKAHEKVFICPLENCLRQKKRVDDLEKEVMPELRHKRQQTSDSVENQLTRKLDQDQQTAGYEKLASCLRSLKIPLLGMIADLMIYPVEDQRKWTEEVQKFANNWSQLQNSCNQILASHTFVPPIDETVALLKQEHN